MKWRKNNWFNTLGAGLFLCAGGCTGLHTSQPRPIDQTAQTTPVPREESPVVTASYLGDGTLPPLTSGDEASAALPGTSSVDEQKGLTLVDAIQTAMAANPDLRSAAARLDVAEGVLSRARAEFFPRISLGEDYAVSNNPQTVFGFNLSQGKAVFTAPPSTTATADDFHTQVSFSQDLYAGGRRLAERRSSQASLEASRCALAEVQNQLAFEVAEAYYRLLQAREFLDVRRQAVDQVKRELEVVTARVRAGTAVRSDALTVEVRLAEVEEALISARHQQELAWAILEKVLGMHVAPHVLPDGVPPAPWSERVDKIEAIVAEATTRRPEVGKLAGNKQAAAQNVRAAEAAKYPTVSLTSSYDVHTNDFTSGNESFYVGVGARLILLDWGRTSSEVRQAKARLHEIEARQASQVLEIELDVRRAYLRLADAQERLQVTTKAVALAEASLKEMEARYRGQTALLTELIDSQVALSNARVRRANAAADVEIARAMLERAAGRLTRFSGQSSQCSPLSANR